MNNNKRIELCNTALTACKELINANEYAEIDDFINTHNEWGIGIELLIDILCEDNIKIENNLFKKIQLAMESMGLGQSDRVVLLKQQIKHT